MSRLISDILEAPEPHFSRAIQSWERISNRAGHDVRLVSESSAARKEALIKLGLDENDTTPRELFYAARHRAAATNKGFEERISVNADDTPEIVVKRIIKFIESLNLPNEAWAAKVPAIKRMLKKQVPKKLLKTLGLRSIDSVLKRSSPAELLILAHKVESSEWSKKMHLQLKSLAVTDFQAEKIKIFNAGADKAQKIRQSGLKKTNLITSAPEAGAVLVTPSAKRFELDTLGLALLLIHELYEQQLYSSYFRHISVKNNFGQMLYDAVTSGLPGKIDDLRIGWRPLHKHLGNNPESVAKIEQPYLQHEHFKDTPPFDVIEKTVPNAEFWKNSSLVFMVEPGSTASMNLMDVIINASNRLPYEKAVSPYLKSKLWEELGCRYLQDGSIENIVIEEINSLQ